MADVVECPVCGSEDRRFFGVSNSRSMVKCAVCGLLMVHPLPSQVEIRKLFENEYIEDDDRVAIDFTSIRMESLRREASAIKRLSPDGGRLLDVGTASGAFLTCFNGDSKWQVEGVEPSKFGARAAARITGRPVHVGFLREQNFPAESLDVVTSLDAFYFHLEPRADIAEMARILKPGGLLAIEIPGLRYRLLKNSGMLCRMIYGVPFRLNAGVHLFYYSRQTLGALVCQFGFEEFAALPEQSPLYGSWLARGANWLYFWASGLLYRVTLGHLNLAPKEFFVYRKVS